MPGTGVTYRPAASDAADGATRPRPYHRLLTGIENDGYRPFRDFTAEPDDLTVIIGANATGKSSLFDFLRFVSRAAQEPLSPEIDERSTGRMPFHGGTPERLSFSLMLDLGQWLPLAYEAEILGPVGRPRVPGSVWPRPNRCMPERRRRSSSSTSRGGGGVVRDQREKKLVRPEWTVKPNELALRRALDPTLVTLSHLQRLLSSRRFYTEERAIQAAGPGHIDLQTFRSYLRTLGLDADTAPQPATEDDLRNRGVLTELGGVLHPTLYGLLAFGRDPQGYPQTRSFWVGCVAYDGTDRAADVILTGEGMGRLDEQVRRAVGWVRGLAKFEKYQDLKREDVFLVPPRALREAVVNAVAHRDYVVTGLKVLLEVFSDRIDVTSPGLLPNRMTVESARAGGHPRSRNELMANYLLVMGLMEQRGRGWPVIRRAMQELNGTDAELVQDEGGKFVRVTLRLGGSGASSLG